MEGLAFDPAGDDDLVALEHEVEIAHPARAIGHPRTWLVEQVRRADQLVPHQDRVLPRDEQVTLRSPAPRRQQDRPEPWFAQKGRVIDLLSADPDQGLGPVVAGADQVAGAQIVDRNRSARGQDRSARGEARHPVLSVVEVAGEPFATMIDPDPNDALSL